MPAPVAPLIGFVLGLFFAWVSGDQLARATGATSRALTLVAWFSLLVYAPIAAYFTAFAPDWSWAYAVDPDRMPAVIDLALVIAAVASAPLGFALGNRQVGPRRNAALVRTAAIPTLLVIGFLGAASTRLTLDATYARFHGDFGVRSVAGSPLGYALLWMLFTLGLGSLITARGLRELAGPRNRERTA